MTATDLNTMHRAVLLDPSDGLARLAFADACEEAGDVERAGFVRRQVVLCPQERFRVEAGTAPAAWVVPTGCQSAVCRRGFVEGVALPLVAFMENARTLFRAHPITAVTLTDRAPNDARVYGGIAKYQWLLWGLGYMRTILIPGGSAMHYDIPVELFAEGRCGWLEFPTMDLAYAALSAACVAYGRRQAGLPPLLGAEA